MPNNQVAALDFPANAGAPPESVKEHILRQVFRRFPAGRVRIEEGVHFGIDIAIQLFQFHAALLSSALSNDTRLSYLYHEQGKCYKKTTRLSAVARGSFVAAVASTCHSSDDLSFHLP
jgi:hypothetical protein